MARLFIAVDLPEEVRERLRDLVPQDASGARRVPADQVHLTLHFIGEGEIDRITPALAEVRAERFELKFEKPGSFKHGRGNRVLWIGVEPCAGLMRLHRATADALLRAGHAPVTRPFTPHVTLARTKPDFSRDELKRWLDQDLEAEPDVLVQEFCLYSSVLSSEGARHQREQVYSLG